MGSLGNIAATAAASELIANRVAPARAALPCPLAQMMIAAAPKLRAQVANANVIIQP
jgi:hypothetical protein